MYYLKLRTMLHQKKRRVIIIPDKLTIAIRRTILPMLLTVCSIITGLKVFYYSTVSSLLNNL